MLLDFTNDPMMVQKHIIESDEDEINPKEVLLDNKSEGSLSEYDSTSSDEEILSQPSTISECEVSEVEISDRAPGLEIREVWCHNLYQEFMEICRLVQQYPFVAMDTEFPGIVAKPVGNFSTMDEYKYQLVKCNVDLLKLIQLGITLFDGSGNLPKGVCTWQFNFKFNLAEDLYAEDSIDLLRNSGIEFEKHSSLGIEPSDFAEMLLGSGLVLMDNVTWLTFHSAYDFGYLLSQLTCQSLPESESEFLETLKIYFPNLYDIKYLMLSTDNLMGGLQKVANKLKVKRVGSQHQAGSDSLLTGKVFFKIYERYFAHGLDDVKYSGQICGFHSTMPNGSNAISDRSKMDESICAEMEELHSSMVSPMREQ